MTAQSPSSPSPPPYHHHHHHRHHSTPPSSRRAPQSAASIHPIRIKNCSQASACRWHRRESCRVANGLESLLDIPFTLSILYEPVSSILSLVLIPLTLQFLIRVHLYYPAPLSSIQLPYIFIRIRYYLIIFISYLLRSSLLFCKGFVNLDFA